MLTSIRWLNRYLSPADLAPDDAERLLTSTSFPIESRTETPSGDTVLDVEVTSNRGDCLCHLNLAREIAAVTGRTLLVPKPDLSKFPKGPAAGSVTSVSNEVPALCPRFTARVIRGVKVGPSPAWLVQALEAVGQRSINNVVDVSNFVLFELGHPSHAFDLNTLAGKRLVVRHARAGESLAALDGRSHKLLPTDLVVADAEKAQSLAGVVGGRDTGVTEKTTDVLLELATWDPPTIRRTARRLGIRTDAGYRFERIVDARDLEWASARCAELILEVAGGTLCDGFIDAGAAPKPRTKIDLRAERCWRVLGIEVPVATMKSLLGSMGIEVAGVANHHGATVLSCLIPHHRPDLLREIDLIEEVARLNQIDNIPIADALNVRLDFKHPAPWSSRERAMRDLSQALTGAGFYETVTFSFLPKPAAAMFLPPKLRLIKIDEERRKDMPYLRPSIIPSLLGVWRSNRDAQVKPDSGMRLFETGSVFAEIDDGKDFKRQTVENVNVGLLLGAPAGMSRADARQHALRALRGTIETLLARLAGPSATLSIDPIPAVFPACEGPKGGGASAGITINGKPAGYIALLNDAALAHWEIDEPAAVAEINLGALIAMYPPKVRVETLPAFPSIERDLSFVVAEATPWASIDALVRKLRLDLLVDHRHVATFRGKPIAPGRKSLTLRLHFRHPDRTLRHEEVDPQVNILVGAAKSELGAELRGVDAT